MENLVAQQGRIFDESAVQRIISLLATTDMTATEIAQRMSCSKSAVLAINRKHHIRNYDGLHSTWRIDERRDSDLGGGPFVATNLKTELEAPIP